MQAVYDRCYLLARWVADHATSGSARRLRYQSIGDTLVQWCPVKPPA